MTAALANPEATPLQHALEAVDALPLDAQESVLDVLQRRVAASRRRLIVREVRQARAAYRAGKVKRGTAADLMAELRAE